MRSVIWLSLLLIGVLISTSFGQDAAPPMDRKAAAISSYVELAKAKNSAKGLEGESSDDARRAHRRVVSCRVAFARTFGECDLDVWDAKAHKSIMVDGFLMMAELAIEEGDGATAVRGLDEFLANFPDHEEAEYVRVVHLPQALCATGDAAMASKRIEALIDEAPKLRRYEVAASWARLLAADGDYLGSRAAFARARKLLKKFPLPKRKEKRTPGLLPMFPGGIHSVDGDLAKEAETVGAPPATLKVTGALGGAKSVARPTPGQVLIVVPFEVTSSLAMFDLRTLVRIHGAIEGQRARLVGVTWFPAEMGKFLPQLILIPGSKRKKAENVLVTEKNFRATLGRWRKAAKLRVPIVSVPEPTLFERLGQSFAAPRIIDGEGRIAFRGDLLTTDAELLSMIRLVLARKPPQEPVAPPK